MQLTLRHTCLAALVAVGVGCTEKDQTPATVTVEDNQAAEQAATTAAAAMEEKAIESGVDYHSYANMQDYRVQHIALDLDVNFDNKTISGTATLDIDALNDSGKPLLLDTRALSINAVDGLDGPQTAALKFNMGKKDDHLGTPLSIDLAGQKKIRISYSTAPEASGVQWLTPEQTAGKKHPFLFTQAQAIHARSFVPLQDSPKARITYSATIRTPKDLLAVMSANNDPKTEKDGEYQFEMPQKVPSYLIALAVGDLEFKAMGERTGVYAEPSVLEAAAKEFEDTEAMLIETEKVYGPYRWDRYDLLILPPSFPFGGMENPRLSFITPTVIAGDKSLTALIAHELAHSWSGNLVTNASWRDLWLNEGFTTYLTNRIMQLIYGDDRYRMEMALGYEDLKSDMADLPDSAEIMAIDLRGKDPDAVFSNVPYEKGSLFLYELENTIGRDNFDKFLRSYFDHFAFQSITTEDFLAYVESTLIAQYPDKLSKERFEQWIFQPGLLADAPKPQSPAFDNVDKHRNGWLEGKQELGAIDVSKWTSHEWKYFLDGMPEALSQEQMAALDGAFNLTQAGNNEVAHSWLMLVVKNDYQPGFERVHSFLTSIGRNKFLRPLYRALKENGKLELAREIFNEAKVGYHPLSVKVNSAILYPEQ
ncbi:MAG: M1 family metallopeptidase [Cellvibrionaceae bacterium]|nr:M1 family metallopeptidase [Cellvibrionaceae bacterium]